MDTTPRSMTTGQATSRHALTALSAASLAVALAAWAPAARAQDWLQDAALIAAPHFTQYTIGSGASERTVTQTAIPFVFVLPFTDRFSVDVTTAFASSQVKTGGATTSTLSGLTDTQVRGNFTFGDFVVFTVGLNLPTGAYGVPDEKVEAAGQIGNDFLNYPISSMGNGFAGTGGVALARAMGAWNVGLGTSMRKSAEFSAFTQSSADFRFTPADEYRVHLRGDRPVRDGQVSFGLAYSAFGADALDTTTAGNQKTTASTGDRITATGMWMFPVPIGEVYLSGWNLYRLEGQQFGGDAPTENVASLNAALSTEVGDFLFQPSLEGRFWQVDGERAGQLVNANLRMRLESGLFTMFPSVGYSVGSLYSGGASVDVSGIRGSLTIRLN